MFAQNIDTSLGTFKHPSNDTASCETHNVTFKKSRTPIIFLEYHLNKLLINMIHYVCYKYLIYLSSLFQTCAQL